MMSLSAYRPALMPWPALSRRLIVMALAIALVAGGLALLAAVIGAWSPPPPPPPRNPFGVPLPREALPSTTGIGGMILAWQSAFYRDLTATLKAIGQNPAALWGLLALSFGYGVFHAAGPGHGKAVISSYVLANEVQLRRGIVLSFVSALLQGVTAVLVVGVGWYVLRGSSVSMTDASNWLEIVSFAMIAAFGAFLLVRKLWRMASRPRNVAGLNFAAAGSVLPSGGLAFSTKGPTTAGRSAALRTRAMPQNLGGGPIMRPAGGLAADICTDDEDCDCGRAHMPDPKALGAEKLTLGSAISAVVAVGLRPCSGAIVVLTFGLLNGLYLGGVLSVFAMALGTAITVSAIAALAVYAKDVALRFGTAGGMRRGVLDAVEILGALLVLLLGLALLGGAIV